MTDDVDNTSGNYVLDKEVVPKSKSMFIYIVLALLFIGLCIGITVKVLADQAIVNDVTTDTKAVLSDILVTKNPYTRNEVRGNWVCKGWLDMSQTENHPMILFRDSQGRTFTRPEWLAAVETSYSAQYCIGIPSGPTDAETIDAIYIAAYDGTWLFEMPDSYTPPESDKSTYYQLWFSEAMKNNTNWFNTDGTRMKK